MTTHNDEYRTRLLEEVRRIRAREEAREMSDEQPMGVITSGLGLPAGTPFTDEQLEMIANYRS